MKIKIIILLIYLILNILLYAEIHIPGGYVSGIWDLDSLYIIDDHIYISQDSALIISPGVNVEFSGSYRFDIHGQLIAVGTQVDSIHFTAQDTLNGWLGIRVIDTDDTFQDSSKFEYCSIQYTRPYMSYDSSGIYINNSSKVKLTNSKISNNYGSYDWGGALHISYSDIMLCNLNITKNETTYGGSAIYVYSSNFIASNLFISNNNSCGMNIRYSTFDLENLNIYRNDFGGIGLNNSFGVINNSYLYYNNYYTQLNNVYGGAIATSDSEIEVNNNVIEFNFADCGGGIYLNNTDCNIQDSIIKNNICLYTGGGIYAIGNDIIIQNTTIDFNYTEEGGGGLATWEIENCVIVNSSISNNTSDFFGGGIWMHTTESLYMINSNICNNYAEVFGGSLMAEFGGTFNILNSIFWGNDPHYLEFVEWNYDIEINYSDIQGGWEGESNLNTYPFFLDNYYLSDDSPCIDAGNPDSLYYDIEDPNNPGFGLWPAMGTITNDMGMYGGHGYYEPITAIDHYLVKNSSTFLSASPNPVKPDSQIMFESNQYIDNVKISVYNLLGQKIGSIRKNINSYLVSVNLQNEIPNTYNSGIYFINLKNKNFNETRKIMILK
ncbi:MAG: T9SS type A sorting domain-containing protein [Candidatus Cloacimonetes bacterium]|nr:T9SS type A sorting domain-containing protein [Candidatus Cloacimonadota bacterium]